MNDCLNYIDELVKEYLIFRGFTQTHHYFSVEKKADKLKSFQVEKILEQINTYITNYDVQHLVELWNFLDKMFFSKIDYNNHYGYTGAASSNTMKSPFKHDITSTIKKLSSSLKKYYLIFAINNNKYDKVKEFFDLYSQELQKDPEWKQWFVLPYTRNPQNDTFFDVYFSKGWSEAFSLSLRNFLSTIFKNMPLPKILQFNLERQNRKRLEAQVENLLNQNEDLRNQLDKYEYLNKREQQQQQDTKPKTMTSSTSSEGFEKVENPSFSRFSRRSESKSSLSMTGGGTSGYGNDEEEQQKGVVIGFVRSRKSIQTGAFTQGLSSSGYEMTELDDNSKSTSTEVGAASGSSLMNTSSGMAMTSPGKGTIKSSSERVGFMESNYIIDSQETVSSHTTPVTRVKFLSNGSKVASSSVDGTIRLWTVDGFSRATSIYCLSEVRSLEWDNKVKLLLCGTSDAKIKLWNSSTDKAVGDINTPAEYPKVDDIVCNPNSSSFVSVHSSISRSDGVVLTWNLRTLKNEDTLPSTGTVINCVTYNNTGSLLAAGCVDGTIRIFNIKSCQSIAGWQADNSEIISVQFNTDDNKLFSLSKNGKLSQWNIHVMGRPEREYEYPGFPSEPHRSTEISFSPDTSSFVIGSSNKFALVYNVENPNPILQISGHTGPVVTVDWHPTQNIIATGSLDQNVRITKLSKI